MSNEKQVSFFVANNHCDTNSNEMHTHCKNDKASIKKSCCKIDTGLIQSDITIPIQHVNSFHPVVYFAVAYFESFQNKLPLSATFKTFFVPDVKPIPKDIQVWQQVFRC